MNTKIYIFFFFLFFTSCDFGNTNIDPNRTTDAELKEILPTALTQTAHNMTAIAGRVAGIVVQQIDGIDAQPASYAQYLIDERTLDELWRTGLYSGAMKDCHLLIEKAEVENAPLYKGIGKVLMAINLGIATSFWGEVPYSEAFQGVDNLQPKYDTQHEIYQSIHQLLAEAIADLELLSTEHSPQTDDLIFNGNPTHWLATAKALQARYFLQMTKKDALSAQKALNAIQSGAFQNALHQPIFRFGNYINEAHPLPLYSFERPDQIVLSDYLYQYMDSINDPRLTTFTFVENGKALIYHADSGNLYWGQFDAPLPFISLSELKFIEAEALLITGDVLEAELAFKNAVESHFKQLNILESQYLPFIQQHIHFNNSPTMEEKLELLIEQKHLALFAQSPIEAWADFRRTGFPNLQIPLSANSSFNPSLVIPKRFIYPISERTSNQTNVNIAIERQGGHLMDNGLWVFE